MNSSVFGHLEASLNDYLGDLVRRGERADAPTATNIARVELPRVISALRATLDDHHPDAHGRCGACRTRRFGRAPVPCRAYLTAHLCLLITDDDITDDRLAPAYPSVRHTELADGMG